MCMRVCVHGCVCVWLTGSQWRSMRIHHLTGRRRITSRVFVLFRTNRFKMFTDGKRLFQSNTHTVINKNTLTSSETTSWSSHWSCDCSEPLKTRITDIYYPKSLRKSRSAQRRLRDRRHRPAPGLCSTEGSQTPAAGLGRNLIRYKALN